MRLASILLATLAFSATSVASTEVVNKATLSSFFSGTAHKEAASPFEANALIKEINQNLDGMRVIPARNIIVAQGKNGKTVVLAENGRYFIGSKLYDLWNDAVIDGIDDVDKYKDIIPTSRLNFDVSKTASVYLGSKAPKRTLFGFIDPSSKHSTSLIAEIERFLAKKGNEGYRFNLFLVSGNKTGAKNAVSLHCLNSNEEKISTIRKGDVAKLPLVQSCYSSTEVQMAFAKSSAMSEMLNVRQVPFLIHHTGQTIKSVPTDLEKWIKKYEK